MDTPGWQLKDSQGLPCKDGHPRIAIQEWLSHVGWQQFDIHALELHQAVKKYKDEIAKLGEDSLESAAFLKRAEECANNLQLTAFESQLVRSLRKEDAEERKKAIVKYVGIYATVPPSTVSKLLMDEAKSLMES